MRMSHRLPQQAPRSANSNILPHIIFTLTFSLAFACSCLTSQLFTKNNKRSESDHQQEVTMIENGLASKDATSSRKNDQPPSKRVKLSGTTTTIDTATLTSPNRSDSEHDQVNTEAFKAAHKDVEMGESSKQKQETTTVEEEKRKEEVVSEEQQKEIKAGIMQYVDSSLEGFQGILKQRYVFDNCSPIALEAEELD